ncbi:O-antigen ligase family protein [Novosphingobium pituita]|uniref:O-antigen ligase-related domain-containing protein n=1 Tax=Novosphingobium pituita TaxID=3056842 RepID=A0ABQ6P9N7_9SPHN|nr:O-antigen ligase family protein [Novosphingobium sp. IK01]GMM61967.1 hypothetical protein NUTIK01_27440 [Novosphingobium sp. IK01]
MIAQGSEGDGRVPWAQRPWRLATVVEGTFSLSGVVPRLYVYCVVVYFSGAITRPLSGNSGSFRDVGEAPMVQALGIAVYLGGAMLGLWGLVQRQLQGRLSISPPLVGYGLLALWVALSPLWSPMPDLGMRRAVAFVGTVMVSCAIATTIPARDIARVLVHCSVGLIVITLALRLALPVYAVHQAGEAGVAEHAGRLRGSYAHKNELARTLALAIIVLLTFGRVFLRGRWLRPGLVLAGMGLAMMSGSAKVLLIIPLAVGGAWFFAIPMGRAVRCLLLLGMAGLVGLVMLSGVSRLIAGGVFASVGRGGDMSGRSLIWEVAWRFYALHPLIGQGYATGWAAGAQAYFAQLKLIVIGHAHNGYINTLLDLGAVGLVLALLPPAMMAVCLVAFPRRIADHLRAFGVAWLVMYLMMNVSGTYLINYNDLYTFTTIVCCFWCHGVFHFRVDVLSLLLSSRLRGDARWCLPGRRRTDVPRAWRTACLLFPQDPARTLQEGERNV